MATVELRFVALPSHVRTARIVATAVGRRSGVPAIVIDEVKLAVGEACARAVSVHQATAPDAPVLVRLSDDDGVFTVEVVDEGPVGENLPPAQNGRQALATQMLDLGEVGAPAETAGDDLPSGLGLALIEGLVDDVIIRVGKGDRGTVVSMRWPLVPPQPDGAQPL